MKGIFYKACPKTQLFESYHLQSGPDANDGLHTINIAEGNLFEEPWEKDYFPYARFSWCKRLYGYWGQGLVEQVQAIQLEVNKLLWVIQRSMHLAGSFKVFIENGPALILPETKRSLTGPAGLVLLSCWNSCWRVRSLKPG